MLILRRKNGGGIIVNHTMHLRFHIDHISHIITLLTSFPTDQPQHPTSQQLEVGKQLCLSDTITLTLFALEGIRVKIGIEAPMHIPILREELVPYPVES